MKIALALYLGYAIGLALALARAGLRSRGPVSSNGPAAPARRILVIGAAGRTGRRIVEGALARGYRVTAFARDPARLAIEHPDLSVVRGDVLDFGTVDAAVAGHDAVLCALGHKRFLGPSDILSEGTGNLLRAMERHGVRRLVCETSLGIGDSAGRMGLWYTLFVIPVILPFYFWDKTRQERRIAGSAADWVIVRPGALTDGPRTGRLRHGRGVGSLLWTVHVARADVAEFMLDQVASGAYVGRAPGVCRGGAA